MCIFTPLVKIKTIEMIVLASIYPRFKIFERSIAISFTIKKKPTKFKLYGFSCTNKGYLNTINTIL